MNRHIFAKCLFIIITLLISHVGKALVTIDSSKHCDMKMMSMSVTSQTSKHTVMMSQSLNDSSSSSINQMDCCDTIDFSFNTQGDNCNSQCECSSLIMPIFVLIPLFEVSEINLNNPAIAFYALHVPKTLIKQTKRPPIV